MLTTRFATAWFDLEEKGGCGLIWPRCSRSWRRYCEVRWRLVATCCGGGYQNGIRLERRVGGNAREEESDLGLEEGYGLVARVFAVSPHP
jgi:hypothetical protein